jgi:hypothetical protein
MSWTLNSQTRVLQEPYLQLPPQVGSLREQLAALALPLVHAALRRIRQAAHLLEGLVARALGLLCARSRSRQLQVKKISVI